MNTKVLIAAVVSGLVAMLLGWGIYGFALKGYFDDNTSRAVLSLFRKDPNWIGMIIGNIAWGGLIAWVLWKMGVTTAGGGFIPGMIIAGLVAVAYDMFFYSMLLWYTGKMVVVVDVVVSAVTGGIMGAVAGWMLGMGKKSG